MPEGHGLHHVLLGAADLLPGLQKEALVELDGKEQVMTFITNNPTWSAWSVAELYRARWEIEVFFKELKRRRVFQAIALYVVGSWVVLQVVDFLTESADLASLHHKLRMRLCYNAQEEIWRASLDEARKALGEARQKMAFRRSPSPISAPGP